MLPVDVMVVCACRTTFIKRVNARGITYLQLAEGTWQDGRAKHRRLKSLGREDQLDSAMIDRLRPSLKRYASKDTIEVPELYLDAITVSPGRRVGSLLPLQSVWCELELGESFGDLARCRRFRFDVVNVVKASVFQRVLNPGSERSLVRSFLPSVFAPEVDGIELQHACRALRFMAEVGPELEARLTRVMTEKLFAAASLVLFDTTSTYFEGTGPEDLAPFGFSRTSAVTDRRRAWRCSRRARDSRLGTGCTPAGRATCAAWPKRAGSFAIGSGWVRSWSSPTAAW